jgi:hypothetical protein
MSPFCPPRRSVMGPHHSDHFAPCRFPVGSPRGESTGKEKGPKDEGSNDHTHSRSASKTTATIGRFSDSGYEKVPGGKNTASRAPQRSCRSQAT